MVSRKSVALSISYDFLHFKTEKFITNRKLDQLTRYQLLNFLKIMPYNTAGEIVCGLSFENLDAKMPCHYATTARRECQTMSRPFSVQIFSCHIFTINNTWFLGFSPTGRGQKYWTVFFLRFSQLCLLWKLKINTSVSKKFLKIFVDVPDIIISVCAKNLDFIPNIELVMAKCPPRIFHVSPCQVRIWQICSLGE